MILIYTIVLFVCIFIINYYRDKNPYIIQYMTVIYMLVLAPTTKLFGVYKLSFYNLQFARYFTILMFPISLIYYLSNRKICRYADRILVSIIIISFILVVSPWLRGGEISRTYLLNVEAFFVVLLYSFYIFSRITYNEVKYVVKNFLLAVTVCSALLSLGTFLNLEPLYTIHKLFYNTFIGTSSLETTFSFVEMYNRPYAIFSATNQFSILSSVAIIFGFYFCRINLMRRGEFIILFMSSLVIIITSGSRTGVVFYLLSLFFIYNRFNVSYKILIIPVIIIFMVLALYVMPERILDSFTSIDSAINALKSQRVHFWVEAISYFQEDFSNLLFGFQEKIMIEGEGAHYESGYLQLIGIGGIVSVIVFLYLFKSLYSLYLIGEEKILSVVFLIFFLAEIVMGVFFELKWSVINGVLISYVIYLAYSNKLGCKVSYYE